MSRARRLARERAGQQVLLDRQVLEAVPALHHLAHAHAHELVGRELVDALALELDRALGDVAALGARAGSRSTSAWCSCRRRWRRAARRCGPPAPRATRPSARGSRGRRSPRCCSPRGSDAGRGWRGGEGGGLGGDGGVPWSSPVVPAAPGREGWGEGTVRRPSPQPSPASGRGRVVSVPPRSAFLRAVARRDLLFDGVLVAALSSTILRTSAVSPVMNGATCLKPLPVPLLELHETRALVVQAARLDRREEAGRAQLLDARFGEVEVLERPSAAARASSACPCRTCPAPCGCASTRIIPYTTPRVYIDVAEPRRILEVALAGRRRPSS